MDFVPFYVVLNCLLELSLLRGKTNTPKYAVIGSTKVKTRLKVRVSDYFVTVIDGSMLIDLKEEFYYKLFRFVDANLGVCGKSLGSSDFLLEGFKTVFCEANNIDMSRYSEVLVRVFNSDGERI
jgi:hypothetical protein